jgi:hypothetical protein
MKDTTRILALTALSALLAAACSEGGSGGGSDASADADTDTDTDTDSDADTDADTDTDTDTDTGSDTDADSGAPCTPGVAASNACDANGDVVALDDCGDQVGGVVDDCLDAASNGVCLDGVCGCADGFFGDDCASCLVLVSGATGDDGNDGSTWALAKATVQAGLDTAAAVIADGDASSCEVWVAAGTYTPTVPTDSGDTHTATILLRANVALYGGFAGDETERDGRDIVGNPTILSGDISEGAGEDPADGGTYEDDIWDNANHVVTGATGATIDGFTITAGNAEGDGAGSYGGGMYNDASSPIVTGCTFSGNKAGYSGGGMHNNDGSSPTVTDCTFSDNTADFGAGMYNNASSPTVMGCTFAGNSFGYGSGMYNNASSPTVVDCAFSGNSTIGYGGGMFNNSSSPTVTNSIFTDNSANFYGGGMYNESSSSPTVTNCTFAANTASTGGGIYNDASSPIVTNCILWGDSGGEIANVSSCAPVVTYSDVAGGCPGTGNLSFDPLFVSSSNLRLQSTSPAIDTGSDAAVPLGVTTDLDGNPRLVDGPDTDTTSTVDMGAYEFQP